MKTVKNCGSCRRKHHHRKRSIFPCTKCVRNTNPMVTKAMPITEKGRVISSKTLEKRVQLWTIRNEKFDRKCYWQKG